MNNYSLKNIDKKKIYKESNESFSYYEECFIEQLNKKNINFKTLKCLSKEPKRFEYEDDDINYNFIVSVKLNKENKEKIFNCERYDYYFILHESFIKLLNELFGVFCNNSMNIE